MPFALLPSLLSLIIIHLPPTTLSCDVLSLCLSLSHPLPPSLSLSHLLHLLLLLAHTTHSIRTLSFASISVCILYSHSPLSLSLSFHRWNAYSFFSRGKEGQAQLEEREVGRKKVGSLEAWVGSRARGKDAKEKKEKEKRRKKEKEERENRIGHSPFGIIGDVRPCDESHWKPGWQREQRCS